MANELATITVDQIGVMAKAIAASNLFGVKTSDQAMALMLISHSRRTTPGAGCPRL